MVEFWSLKELSIWRCAFELKIYSWEAYFSQRLARNCIYFPRRWSYSHRISSAMVFDLGEICNKLLCSHLPCHFYILSRFDFYKISTKNLLIISSTLDQCFKEFNCYLLSCILLLHAWSRRWGLGRWEEIAGNSDTKILHKLSSILFWI